MHQWLHTNPSKNVLVLNVWNQANFYKDLYEVTRAKPWQYLITDWWKNAKFRHGGIFHLDLSEYYNQTSDFTNKLFVTSSLRYSIPQKHRRNERVTSAEKLGTMFNLLPFILSCLVIIIFAKEILFKWIVQQRKRKLSKRRSSTFI